MKSHARRIVFIINIFITTIYPMTSTKGEISLPIIIVKQFIAGALQKDTSSNHFTIYLDTNTSESIEKSLIIETLTAKDLSKRINFSTRIAWKMFQKNLDLPQSSYEISDHHIKSIDALKSAFIGWQERQDLITEYVSLSKATCIINAQITLFPRFRELMVQEHQETNLEFDHLMLTYLSELKANRQRYLNALHNDKIIINTESCPIQLEQLIAYKKREKEKPKIESIQEKHTNNIEFFSCTSEAVD